MKGYPIQMVLHSLLLALSLALMLIDLVPRLRFIISKESEFNTNRFPAESSAV